MNSNLRKRISDIYRKNKDEGIALILFSLPYFVYKNSDYLPENNIPVFSFHSVKPGLLEEQFKYLSENNYKTLDSQSFYDVLTGNTKGTPNSIVLTFDDGRKSLWTTAFPLLKKYNFTAVSFIVPSIIENDEIKSPSLDDVWEGKGSLNEVENIESEKPFCSWKEIKEMNLSGYVDFQSHSMYHASVFNNRKLVDFINPGFEASLLNSTLNPLEYCLENPKYSQQLLYGLPVYQWESNLTARSRFVPNEHINNSCIEYVHSHGDLSFFKNAGWRNELFSHFTKIKGNSEEGEFQNYQERIAEIKKDLLESRKTIEGYINKPVKHLCLPWYFGNDLTVQLSKETGYECIYWGIKNTKSTNFIGDNPFYIKRINDYYIFSLPGKNRISLGKQILNKIQK